MNDLAHIAVRLETSWLGGRVELRESTESTNDDAWRLVEQGAPNGTLVVADHQTRGRGAHGHTWASPAGTDLYFSFIVGPRPIEHTPSAVTLVVGAAVARALEGLLESRVAVTIKWPNDVLIGSKKVAGVLTEASTSGTRTTLVVGIGINVNREAFEGDLAATATSLTLESGRTLDRSRVLATVLTELESGLDGMTRGRLPDAIRNVETRLAWRGAPVECDGVHGFLDGLEPDGALRIVNAAGSSIVRAGTLRRSATSAKVGASS